MLFKIKYCDGSHEFREFANLAEAMWCLRSDDIVAIERVINPPQTFWIEYRTGDKTEMVFETLKEGYDYVYSIGPEHIRNYGVKET